VLLEPGVLVLSLMYFALSLSGGSVDLQTKVLNQASRLDQFALQVGFALGEGSYFSIKTDAVLVVSELLGNLQLLQGF
jgi:hypothetical protein